MALRKHPPPPAAPPTILPSRPTRRRSLESPAQWPKPQAEVNSDDPCWRGRGYQREDRRSEEGKTEPKNHRPQLRDSPRSRGRAGLNGRDAWRRRRGWDLDLGSGRIYKSTPWEESMLAVSRLDNAETLPHAHRSGRWEKVRHAFQTREQTRQQTVHLHSHTRIEEGNKQKEKELTERLGWMCAKQAEHTRQGRPQTHPDHHRQHRPTKLKTSKLKTQDTTYQTWGKCWKKRKTEIQRLYGSCSAGVDGKWGDFFRPL